NPDPVDPQASRLRWLGRGVVLAIGLWFIADGLSGMWSGGDTAARVMIVVAVVLGVAFAVLGVRYLARRGREG
ncbi:MAG: hypothetical protein ACXW3O_16135, partial [Brevundimonas sp.]